MTLSIKKSYPNLWDLVCEVDYSKKLNELGVHLPSLFYYVKKKEANPDIKREGGIMYIHEYINFSEDPGFKMDDYEIYNAYTSGELDDILPESIPNEGDLMIWNNMEEDERIWSIEYAASTFPDYFSNKNGANARAAMLIFLLENGYVS